MTNSKVVIRVARPTENNKVASVAAKYSTFNGTIVHVSNDVVIEGVGAVENSHLLNKRGTIGVSSFDDAEYVLEEILSAFANKDSKEDRNPYVYLIIEVDETSLIRWSDPSNPNTRTEGFNFLDVETVLVESDAPVEVKSSHPLLKRTIPVEEALRGEKREAKVNSGSRNMLQVRKLRQVEASRRSIQTIPSFNRNIVESVEEVEEQSLESLDSLDSQQDKLNAIAVAMKAAGMSGAEIAQALKAELELVV
ncbi:MAG: hypothetical protein AAF378_22150 [Cyanobacteria bacterium P01_A01_bin.84]